MINTLKNFSMKSSLMILPEYVNKEIPNCGPTFFNVFNETEFRPSECFPP